MNRPMLARSLRPACVILSLTTLAPTALAQLSYRTIVLSGQPAPGAGPGVTFSFFSDPRVNDAGRVAFWSDLAGTGISNANEGSIWSDRAGALPGTLVLIAREGDPAPWSAGTTFASIPFPTFNNSGLIGFTGSVTLIGPVGNPNNVGIYNESAGGLGTLGIVAQEGTPAPGLPTNYAGLPPAPLNSLGQTAFAANNGGGLWTTRLGGGSGTPQLVAKTGDHAPGTSGTTLFAFLDQPAQNDAGLLLFRATLSGPDVTPDNGMGLWSDRSGSLDLLARAGDPAPGTPSGVNFSTFAITPALSTRPTPAAGGTVAFWASLAGAGIDATNNSGLWTDAANAGTLALLARAGDPAPGAPAGQVYASFSQRPSINAGGSIAFTAAIAGTAVTASNNSGLWLADRTGNARLIAREGDQVPGLPAGVQYAVFGDPSLTDRTQLAFLAQLRGPGTTQTTNQALLATDTIGRVRIVARLGDQFNVAAPGNPPDLRTIKQIVFDTPPAQTGLGQFNASGALAFKLVFVATPITTTSGLFTAIIPSAADFNGDGVVNIQDFLAYIQAYASADPRADYTGDGQVTVQDFLAYLAAYAAG